MGLISQSKLGIKSGVRMYNGKRFYLDLVYTDRLGAQEYASKLRKKGRVVKVVLLKNLYWGVYVKSLQN